jgi:hypothetical protein
LRYGAQGMELIEIAGLREILFKIIYGFEEMEFPPLLSNQKGCM